jgi:hypothetical protein
MVGVADAAAGVSGTLVGEVVALVDGEAVVGGESGCSRPQPNMSRDMVAQNRRRRHRLLDDERWMIKSDITILRAYPGSS